MNKLIDEQLKKCLYASVPPYSDKDTCIYIPKAGIRRKLEATPGRMFHIEISDTVLYPQEGSTLHINWNGGTVPPGKYMNIYVIQTMGKMFKVEGIAVDRTTGQPNSGTWVGWLPSASVTFIKELDIQA